MRLIRKLIIIDKSIVLWYYLNEGDVMSKLLKEIEDMIDNPQKYPSYTNRADLKKALLEEKKKSPRN